MHKRSRTPAPLGDTRRVSTAEVARALGVGVSTVKRWVDDGILPADRTPGGHRKLLVAEVARLVRAGKLPYADLTRLGVRASRRSPADPRGRLSDLLAALRRADGDAVRAILHGAYEAGTPADAVADDLVSPAMEGIGHEWSTGAIDVLHEHRATQACAAALFELKRGLEANAARGRPVAVGGAPEGDHYVLPTLLAQMALLDLGWDAVNLGPNTPMASLRQALREFRPRLAWVSVSHLADAAQFQAEYSAFYREAAAQGVAVAVGGRALTEAVRAQIAYTTHGDRLEHLAAFARTLHRPPSRPRRGRPPRT